MTTHFERICLPNGSYDLLMYRDERLTRATRFTRTVIGDAEMFLETNVLDSYLMRPTPTWTIVTLDAYGKPLSQIPVGWVPRLTWSEELQPGIKRVFVLVDVELDRRIAYYAAVDVPGATMENT